MVTADPGLDNAAWAVAAAVPDPELPCVTVAELGILRDVLTGDDGAVVARVTPTYSGCPAVRFIEDAIRDALTNAGYRARIERVVSPPWTTDWISDAGREKLRAYGIAPPVMASNSKRALFGETIVTCPKCGSQTTEKISEFGSTPCKAHYRCTACLEPFDYFKCI
jgi:ring-1,2-phenylacetyl-CoA epoxidase subunit PaaD